MKHPIINILGEHLLLHPSRAAFWSDKRILLVADTHFGKGAYFRANGLPVPGGTTADDLARLSALVRELRPDRLIVLGDLFHGPPGDDPATVRRIQEHRSAWQEVALTLIPGNHDKRPESLARLFPDAAVEAEVVIPPFALRHQPVESASGYVIAGHVHPGARLVGPLGKETLPCFYFGEKYALLPAFGAFTGCGLVRPAAGDRVHVIADDTVIDVSSILHSRRKR